MAGLNKAYIFLCIAILTEVIATSCLKASNGFTRPLPSAVTVLGYCASFYFLSLTLASIPTGVAYAIWSGIGIILISFIGWLLFDQSLDGPALLGMGLIATGVIVINVFSRTAGH